MNATIKYFCPLWILFLVFPFKNQAQNPLLVNTPAHILTIYNDTACDITIKDAIVKINLAKSYLWFKIIGKEHIIFHQREDSCFQHLSFPIEFQSALNLSASEIHNLSLSATPVNISGVLKINGIEKEVYARVAFYNLPPKINTGFDKPSNEYPPLISLVLNFNPLDFNLNISDNMSKNVEIKFIEALSNKED